MDLDAAPTFAALLRRHRLATGLTQERLAERANLSVRAVSDLERGLRTAPRRDTVDLLSAALELAPDDRAALRASVPRHRGPAMQPTISSLPPELTPLIGREQDEARVIHLLRWEGVRLLTLTGPGGWARPGLAVHVARKVAGDFEDGVVFVSLASIGDPSLVPTTLASSVGVHEQEGQSIEAALVCTAAVAGAPRATRQLRAPAAGGTDSVSPACRLPACDGAGHQPCPLAPAAGAGDGGSAAAGACTLVRPILHDRPRSPAATLFVQRARAVRPELRLGEASAQAVAEICYRLDGLPLAIELAAARIKLFSPQDLLQRLGQPLDLLTGGAADQPVRQQTLRNTIDWSHSLLTRRNRRSLPASASLPAAARLMRPRRFAIPRKSLT